MFADAGRGIHGTGTWYLWYLANLVDGSRGAHLLDKDWVLTEDGTATLGYLAKSAGDGGGHVLPKSTINGDLAAGDFSIVLEQHLSECAAICDLIISHVLAESINLLVCPDDKFPPNDIYLTHK